MDLFINKFIDKVSESDDLEDLLNYLSKEDRRILENRFFKEKLMKKWQQMKTRPSLPYGRESQGF